MFRPILTASRLAARSPKRNLWTTPPKHKSRNRHDASQYLPNQQPSGQKMWGLPVKSTAVILVFGSIFYINHLEQVPETGRWHFMTFSHKSEALFGRRRRRDFEKTNASQILPPDHPLSRHIRKVTSRILKSSNLGRVVGDTPTTPSPRPSPFFGLVDIIWRPSGNYGEKASHSQSSTSEEEWDVVVVDDKGTVNAMAAPGFIVIYTGILPVCRDEQGLAAVLSHEIGHLIARHPAELLSSRVFFTGMAYALLLIGLDFLGVSFFINHYLLDLPNSRTQEYEADLIGIRLMSRACYDPAESIQMFKRLGAATGSRGFAFLRTHPSTGQRIKQLEEALPEAYLILASNSECSALRDQFERSVGTIWKTVTTVTATGK